MSSQRIALMSKRSSLLANSTTTTITTAVEFSSFFVHCVFCVCEVTMLPTSQFLTARNSHLYYRIVPWRGVASYNLITTSHGECDNSLKRVIRSCYSYFAVTTLLGYDRVKVLEKE